MPYREAPLRPGRCHCEICGSRGETQLCGPCNSIALQLDALEIPVVIVDYDWQEDETYMGIGMVLIDRWYVIARCACRVHSAGISDPGKVARERAALWTPTARIAGTEHERREALEETLERTSTDRHRAVRTCFERTADWLRSYTSRAACGFQEVGTEINTPPWDHG